MKQGFIVVCTACVLLSLWLSQYIPADIFDKIVSPLQLDRWMEQEKPYVNPAFQLADLRAALPLTGPIFPSLSGRNTVALSTSGCERTLLVVAKLLP